MTKETKIFREWSFAQKRDEWMRRLASVPERDIASGAKLVGFRLTLYMHEWKRRAHPGYDQLGSDCGMGARVVQTHTKALEKAGWIEVRRRRNIGNTYWLRYPWERDPFSEQEYDNGTGVPLVTEP
jgi:DNA-binding transcriptional ArsR family regulator|uniref:Putative DNA binding, helix-turn-helix domain containing protein n=1 Tax=viral metagenome TaxID=1070528 RepID=A0A6H1ZC35_9ZZZZ